MKLSIIISTWNSIGYIKECLESIFRLSLDLEIIVVDSNSKDGTQEFVKSLGEPIRLVSYNRRLTWSEANQVGLDMSQGDWICLSNPDIVFSEAFAEMFKDCEKNTHILAAAPQLIFPDGRLQRPARTITPWLSLCAHTRMLRLVFKKARINYLAPYPSLAKPFPADSPQGSLFMFQRSVLNVMKGRLWNEGYLNGVSDFDAFLNLKRKGIPIWLFPQYKMIHYGSYITKRYPKWIEKDQTRGFVLYFRYWQKAGGPVIRGWFSPKLYSVLYGLEGIAATCLEIAGRIVKHGNPFFTPKWSAWQAGERILGLIDGWRYRIDR